MTLERNIFYAAKNGNLLVLKLLLSQRAKVEHFFLVSLITEGSTPLLMACIYGHLEIVLFLVEKLMVNIEQVGDINVGGETIKEATPLFCAVISGHLNIVECLVRNKASLDYYSKPHLSPLAHACIRGKLDIVKYLVQNNFDIELSNNGFTALMEACLHYRYDIAKYLIECGADMNREYYGDTCLHMSARSGYLNLVKLLLQKGATIKVDSDGKTPLYYAAFRGHVRVVEYITQEINCSKQDKINSWELLGALFAVLHPEESLAHNYWWRSMELQYEDINDPSEKYANCIDCTDLSSFVDTNEVMIGSESENIRLDPHEMVLKGLILIERKKGIEGYLSFLEIMSNNYANKRDILRSLQLWKDGLDMLPFEDNDDYLPYWKKFSFAISESLQFATQCRCFYQVLCLFEKTLKEIKRAMAICKVYKQGIYCKISGTIFMAVFLLNLMYGILGWINKTGDLKQVKDKTREVRKAAYKLVHLTPRNEIGWTELHCACYHGFLMLSADVFKSTDIPFHVVNLLLEVGASPNYFDSKKNTPLHIAARGESSATAVIETLLNHGAHIDVCNVDKETPLQMIQHMHSLDIKTFNYLSLKCLSAKKIQLHKILYKGLVHKSLEAFIDMH